MLELVGMVVARSIVLKTGGESGAKTIGNSAKLPVVKEQELSLRFTWDLLHDAHSTLNLSIKLEESFVGDKDERHKLG